MSGGACHDSRIGCIAAAQRFDLVSQGPRERMELHAQAMHDYGLWATVRQEPR